MKPLTWFLLRLPTPLSLRSSYEKWIFPEERISLETHVGLFVNLGKNPNGLTATKHQENWNGLFTHHTRECFVNFPYTKTLFFSSHKWASSLETANTSSSHQTDVKLACEFSVTCQWHNFCSFFLPQEMVIHLNWISWYPAPLNLAKASLSFFSCWIWHPPNPWLDCPNKPISLNHCSHPNNLDKYNHTTECQTLNRLAQQW